MRKVISPLIFMFYILGCGQGTYSPNKVENEKKFYYPKMNDKFWRTYKPNLTGAEGWIKKDCINKEFVGQNVIVLFEAIEHFSWGNYKGHLRVKVIESSKEIYIDFKCFKPNYEKGEWLGPKLEIPSYKR
ncbi:hypothetical protein [Aquimarina sp. 2304DJ70-9]|uniref:hypothetical protein n=1 Tax=Aquimarina penaris TaxID=3231044 RepID=UPI003463233E